MGRMAKRASRSHVPQEIQANILSRLPVKTLIKFRSVCKSWYALMADSYFIIMHHKTRSKINPHIMSIFRDNNKESTRITDVNASSIERWIRKIPGPKAIHDAYKLVGSCNGIVCIRPKWIGIESPIYLWNPALNTFKTIGQPEEYRRFVPYTRNNYLEFCFHEDDYKVVIITTRLFRKEGDALLEEVAIYSLHNNSWRTIEAAPPSTMTFSYLPRGVYINGALHWPGTQWYIDPDDNVIISFDMVEEVFKEIKLPTICRRVKTWLFNYKGSLAFYAVPVYDDYPECPSFWVMKEYGVQGSWTKQCNINVPRPPAGLQMGACKGLVRDNLLILLGADGSVIIYDVDRQERSSSTNIQISSDASEVTDFGESLLSLDP